MNPSPSQPDRPRMSVMRAILLGQLVVNFPLFLIVLVLFILSGIFFPNDPWIALVGAVLLGWGWWSISTRRWRAWAISKGVPPRELTRMAAFTGLARPRDWYMYDLGKEEDENEPRHP
uniref:Uncharacterized protein n=1 Tax=Anaerolinea thermolimosa TaxID=229919 RepID=A0A7C4KL91_9CHLR